MARKTRQLVINLEDSFYSQFIDLSIKENISSSALGRRLIIRHLIEIGVLPETIALEALLQ